MVRWCWVNFGRLTNFDKSKARPNCAYSRYERVCLDIFFTCLSFLFSISLSMGDDPIKTKILSQKGR